MPRCILHDSPKTTANSIVLGQFSGGILATPGAINKASQARIRPGIRSADFNAARANILPGAAQIETSMTRGPGLGAVKRGVEDCKAIEVGKRQISRGFVR